MMTNKAHYWQEVGLSIEEVPRRPRLAIGQFLEEHLERSQPVVIEDAIKEWPAFQRWSAEYLAEKLPNKEVRMAPGESGFPIGEAREPAEVAKLGLHEYIRRVLGTDDSKSSLQGYIKEQSLLGDAASLLSDIHIPEYLQDVRLLIEANVWIGPPGNLTPLHYDQMHNLFAQIRGQKEMLLLSPDQLERAYLWPINTSRDRRSRADLSNLDFERFPRLKEAQFLYTLLEPGDLLFLPAYWLHDVRTLATSISVNLWWRPPLRHCLVPGLFRHLSRDNVYINPRMMLARAFELGDLPPTPLAVARYLFAQGEVACAAVLGGAVLTDHYLTMVDGQDREFIELLLVEPSAAIGKLARDGQVDENEAKRSQEVLPLVAAFRSGRASLGREEACIILDYAEEICGTGTADGKPAGIDKL